ncbi:hypothetical protein BB8028_0005g10030 [Beauveria bassiana]|uniref:Uncharacterized protein n=1 Tax=Beauveria bassiana TaxID=176275 RepID=A0A2S7YH27_BEABA|nr:hypothetical protein BB8028_0005g10030 [Beauveria bassiana]
MTIHAEDQTVGFLKLPFDGMHSFLDAAHKQSSLAGSDIWPLVGPQHRTSRGRAVEVCFLQHELAFDEIILPSYSRYGIFGVKSVGKEQIEFWQTKGLRAPIRHAITANVAIDMVKGLQKGSQKGSPETHIQDLITGSAHLIGQSLGALGGEEVVMTTK